MFGKYDNLRGRNYIFSKTLVESWSDCDTSACFHPFLFFSGCCWCCAALRPRYKRLVDNIFPVNPQVRSPCLLFSFPFPLISAFLSRTFYILALLASKSIPKRCPWQETKMIILFMVEPVIFAANEKSNWHMSRTRRSVLMRFSAPQDGLIKNNMEKLTFYSLSSPEKLDRIGEYLFQRASRDIYRYATKKRDVITSFVSVIYTSGCIVLVI